MIKMRDDKMVELLTMMCNEFNQFKNEIIIKLDKFEKSMNTRFDKLESKIEKLNTKHYL
jgi:hypothetical protein